MKVGYIDKPDPLGNGGNRRFFKLENTSIQDIFDILETPKELQKKLMDSVKIHPGIKNRLWLGPKLGEVRNYIGSNILGAIIDDAIIGNNGENSARQRLNNYLAKVYESYQPGSSVSLSTNSSLKGFSEEVFMSPFDSRANLITGHQRYEYYQQHGIPKSNTTISSSTASENVSNVSGGAANINETSPVFNSAAKKGHTTAVEEYINNRKAALRASGDEKLASSVDNIITPQVDNIDHSAELDNFNKILDRQFGKQKTVLSDEGTQEKIENPAANAEAQVKTDAEGQAQGQGANGANAEAKPKEIKKKFVSNTGLENLPDEQVAELYGFDIEPSKEGTRGKVPISESDGATRTARKSPLENFTDKAIEEKYGVFTPDKSYKIGGKNYDSFVSGLEEQARQANLDPRRYTVEELEDMFKRGGSNAKPKGLGHGKVALAVGTAVTAGALVLGLSNSRGQQSNAQLYGQQPLSY